MAKNERVEYLDIFRGLGILMMIMGHIDFGNIFSYFIHAFHMPMFFFVSGYFFKNNEVSIRQYAKKKAKGLLVPYISFGLFHYVIWQLINIDNLTFRPLLDMFWVNTEETLAICNAIWFLTAMFLIEILYYTLNRICQNIKLLTIAVCVIALIGNFSKYLIPFRLPWALDAAFVGLGFYHVARLARMKNNVWIDIINSMNIFKCIVGGIVTGILIFINGYINMRTQTYAIVPLFWINALFALFVGISFSHIIQEKIINNKVVNLIKNIGKNSITYLCLNQLIILLCNTIISKFDGSFWLTRFPILIIVLSVLLFVDKVIRNSKLRIILGKKIDA